jgi:precorrin-4/cobalt-precorrin-4 C11-methyltransferase
LADAGIGVEVVPGLSAYQATASALQSELTIPGLVQTIVLSRAGGRTGVPEREALERLAALRASLCLYLSARHVEEVQTELLRHYPAETPVAIGYRVSWPDEWIQVVPLADMARVSQERQLIRTTLYVVSPALAAPEQARSKLYLASHSHLFRGGMPDSPGR